MISIEADIHRLIEMEAGLLFLGSDVLGLAAVAVDRTLADAQETLVEELDERINAPRMMLAQRVFAKDTERTGRRRVQAELDLSGRPISLAWFSPVQTQKGVTYRPHTKGRARLAKGAFGPNIPRLGRGVFRRAGKKRLPIRKVPGINLKRDSQAQDAVDATNRKVPELLRKNTISMMRSLDSSGGVLSTAINRLGTLGSSAGVVRQSAFGRAATNVTTGSLSRRG